MKKTVCVLITILSIISLSCVRMATLTIDGDVKTDEKVLEKDELVVDVKFVEEPEKSFMNNVFACNQDSLDVKSVSRMVEVKIDHHIGQCFGIWFEPRSISDSTKVSYKAKYRGTDSLEVIVGFTDSDGGVIYDSTMSATLVGDHKGFTSHEFDFTDLLENGEPTFNSSTVSTVIFYLNPKARSNLDGLLTVKSIEMY